MTDPSLYKYAPDAWVPPPQIHTRPGRAERVCDA